MASAKRFRHGEDRAAEPEPEDDSGSSWNYTVQVMNVPADYTHDTLVELHEAADLDAKSLQSSKFEPAADGLFCKVWLRYSDDTNAKKAAEALDGQEVAGEADVVRKLKTVFSWTKGPSEIKPSVYISDIPIDYEDADIRNLHVESGLDVDQVISMKFLSSRDPTYETRSCIVRYNDKVAAEAAIAAIGGKALVTASGRQKHLGARMAKPAGWMLNKHGAESQEQMDSSNQKRQTQKEWKSAASKGISPSNLTPAMVTSFCEKWSLMESTHAWLKAQSIEVQTGVLNRYEDPKDLGKGDGPVNVPEGALVITGLPEDADQDFVEALLSMYGACSTCEISPGSAVVVMETEDDAKLVVEEMNGITPEGMEKPLGAKFADSVQKDRQERRDKAIKQLGMILQNEHANSVAAAYRRAPPPPPPGMPPPQNVLAPPPPAWPGMPFAAPPPGYAGQKGSKGKPRPAAPVDTKGLIPGMVKLWNSQKQFGFIKADGGGDDIFVHRSVLVDGDMLVKDAPVHFDAAKDESGKWKASKVVGATWTPHHDAPPGPPPGFPFPPPFLPPGLPPPGFFPPPGMMFPPPFGAGSPVPTAWDHLASASTPKPSTQEAEDVRGGQGKKRKKKRKGEQAAKPSMEEAMEEGAAEEDIKAKVAAGPRPPSTPPRPQSKDDPPKPSGPKPTSSRVPKPTSKFTNAGPTIPASKPKPLMQPTAKTKASPPPLSVPRAKVRAQPATSASTRSANYTADADAESGGGSYDEADSFGASYDDNGESAAHDDYSWQGNSEEEDNWHDEADEEPKIKRYKVRPRKK